MNNIRVFILFSYILISTAALFPEDLTFSKSLKIACVGDSLTHGYGLFNRKKDSYPSQIESLLPPDWEVRNFGVNGACATEDHSDFYLNNSVTELVEWEADMIILMLGSNDSKNSIWKSRMSYIKGLERILNRIKGIKTEIVLITPPPCHTNVFGIRNDRIHDDIIPALQWFSDREGYTLLDTGKLFRNEEGIFLDNIHLNTKGYGILSRFLADFLMNQPVS